MLGRLERSQLFFQELQVFPRFFQLLGNHISLLLKDFCLNEV